MYTCKSVFCFDTLSLIFRIYNGTTGMSILMNILFILVWTYILGWFCKKGFTIATWILVLSPILFMIIYTANSNLNKKSETK